MVYDDHSGGSRGSAGSPYSTEQQATAAAPSISSQSLGSNPQHIGPVTKWAEGHHVKATVVEEDLVKGTFAYEIEMKRPLDMRLNEDGGRGVYVESVHRGGNAEAAGVRAGDRLLAMSATFGNKLWAKTTLEGVVSALRTRFVLSDTVRLRFERALEEEQRAAVRFRDSVTHQFDVTLPKPLGLELEQHRNETTLEPIGVIVKGMQRGSPADVCGRIQVGDRIKAISASFGSKMWEHRSVDGAASALNSWVTDKATLRIERTVDLGKWEEEQALRLLSASQDPLQPTDLSGNATAAAAANATDFPISSVPVMSLAEQGGRNAQIVVLERCNALVKAFGRSRNVAAIERLVEQMKTTGIRPDARFCNVAMTATLLCRRPDRAIFLFEILTAGDFPVEPNAMVLTTLIKAYSKAGRLEEAFQLVEETVSRWGVQPDSAMLNGLMSACVYQNQLTRARDVFDTAFPKFQVRPDTRTYNILIDAYARAKRVGQAFSTFKEMQQAGLWPDIMTMTTLLKAQMRRGDIERAMTTFEEMTEVYELTPDAQTFNTLIFGLSRVLRWEEALKVLGQMEAEGFQPTLITYSYLMSGFVNARLPEKAIQLFSDMVAKGVQPNVQVYTTLITAHAKMRNVNAALEALKEMTGRGLKPNGYTYTAAMQACLEDNQPSVALLVHKEMTRVGVEPDLVVNTFLVRAYGQLGESDKAFEVLNAMDKSTRQQDRPGVAAYNYLLDSCIRKGNFDCANRVVKSFAARNLTPSHTTFEIMAALPEFYNIDDPGLERLTFLTRIRKICRQVRNWPYSSALYLAILEECMARRDWQLASEVKQDRVAGAVYIQGDDQARIDTLEFRLQRKLDKEQRDQLRSMRPEWRL